MIDRKRHWAWLHGAVAIVASMSAVAGHAQTTLQNILSDELSFMQDEEPEMRRAFERARVTLDDFLQKAKAPPAGTGYYAVKVGISEGKATEYFWIGSFVQDGNTFSGTLDKTPRLVKNVREGQTYRFARSRIVDWMYFDRTERRMHGNFTMCALLTKEPPAEAEKARRQYGLRCD